MVSFKLLLSENLYEPTSLLANSASSFSALSSQLVYSGLLHSPCSPTRVKLHRGQVVSTRFGILDTLRSKKLHLDSSLSVLIHLPRRYIPIIASVSEHQPTAWPAFFMDLQFLIFLFPAGVVLCFRDLRDEHVFVIIYSVMASYFAGVMVRLILALTPVVCVASAIALSSLIDTFVDPFQPPTEDEHQGNTLASAGSTNPPSTPTSKKAKKAAATATAATPTSPALPGALGDLISASAALSKGGSPRPKGIFSLDTRVMILIHTACLLCFFVLHCTWVTSNAYSSPSVVLASSDAQGNQNIIDDFREAYYWLRQNTPTDAVVMSWWDYGYQIAGMADRPTLVDNNTWNNSLSSLIDKKETHR